jgi:hypothetical protein
LANSLFKKYPEKAINDYIEGNVVLQFVMCYLYWVAVIPTGKSETCLPAGDKGERQVSLLTFHV